jgi:hypothetical protein
VGVLMRVRMRYIMHFRSVPQHRKGLIDSRMGVGCPLEWEVLAGGGTLAVAGSVFRGENASV